MAVGVLLARTDDLEEVVAVLARAYTANPLICWALPDDATREESTRAWLRPSLAHYLEDGIVHAVRADGCVVACAAWRPATGLAPADGRRPADALAALVGASRADEIGAAMSVTSALAPPSPAHYLNYLGVDPAHRRRGLGAALVRAGVQAADDDGVDAWLCTSDPTNEPFYTGFGFTVTGRRALGGGPVLAAMHRPRQAGAGSANQTTVSP